MRVQILRNLQNNLKTFETAPKADRDRNVKYFKDIFKDIFEIVKNILIVATIQVAANATNSTFLKFVAISLNIALLMYIISCVMERFSLGIKYSVKGFIGIVFKIILIVIAFYAAESYVLKIIQELVIIGSKCKI